MNIDCDCAWCGEPIEPEALVALPHVDAFGPRKLPWHKDCLLRSVVGGANHQGGTCTCCGGANPPDPPGLSRREAARLAATIWRVTNASSAASCRLPSFVWGDGSGGPR